MRVRRLSHAVCLYFDLLEPALTRVAFEDETRDSTPERQPLERETCEQRRDEPRRAEAMMRPCLPDSSRPSRR